MYRSLTTIGQVISYPVKQVYSVYNETNPATLSGAIDIVVVETKEGELVCSPFHVRFGKLKLLRPSDKIVEVSVNGELTDLQMKVGEQGEAFFVVETYETVGSEYATSPIPTPSEMMEEPEPLFLDAPNIEDENEAIGYMSAHGSESNFGDQNRLDGIHISPSLHTIEVVSSSIVEIPPFNETSNDQPDKTLTLDTDLELTLNETNFSAPLVTANETIHHISFLEEQTALISQLSNKSFDPIVPSPTIDEFVIEDNTLVNEQSIIDEKTSLGTDPIKAPPLPTTAMEVSAIKVTSFEPIPLLAKKTTLQQDENDLFFSSTDLTQQNQKDLNYKRFTSPLSDGGMETEHLDELRKGPLSDTEVDYQHETLEMPAKGSWSWGWGGLPTTKGDLQVQLKKDGKGKEMGYDEKVDRYLSGMDADRDTLANEDQYMQLYDDLQPAMEISTCGLDKIDEVEELFMKNIVSYSQLCENPIRISLDPQIVVKINGKYMNWQTAGPILLSIQAFKKPLSLPAVLKLDKHLSDVKRQSSYSYRRAFSSWFSLTSNYNLKENNSMATDPSKKIEQPPALSARSSSPPLPTQQQPPLKHNYAKTIRLSSDQLKALNLKKGESNTVTFSAYSTLQGKAQCTSKIFFWGWDTKIVISDVDGTITKSDALGHLFAMVGKDWTHSGVASLYTNIANNGYKLLYLTSRAIGQATYTRDYLNKVEQDSHQLPEGPMIMSPDRLFTAFHREVILRKPEEFKIAALSDIKRLFGYDQIPFYAGFGNRITDAISYKKVDVPTARIFTIDPTGKIQLELLAGYESSYIKLNDMVDQIFPPVGKVGESSESFNDWNYWKPSFPEIVLSEIVVESEGKIEIGDVLIEDDDDEEFDDDDSHGEDDFADVQVTTEVPYN